MLGAALAAAAVPQLLPLPPPLPLSCWQHLLPVPSPGGCHPSPGIVGGKARQGAPQGPPTLGLSPSAQLLGFSAADVVQNRPCPCKGMQCKGWACAGLTPKQLGTPHPPPERVGEPGIWDRAQAEASVPPPAPQGLGLVASPRPAPMV